MFDLNRPTTLSDVAIACLFGVILSVLFKSILSVAIIYGCTKCYYHLGLY